MIPIYDSSVQLYCPSLVCTPTFISRPSISREGEKKKERKGKENKVLPRKDAMGIRHTITPTYPPLSDFSHAFAPALRSRGAGGGRERRKKRKNNVWIMIPWIWLGLALQPRFIPCFPPPPSYLPYPIPTPRDQAWSETEALAYNTANQT